MRFEKLTSACEVATTIHPCRMKTFAGPEEVPMNSIASDSDARPAFARIDETHDPLLESWVESASGHQTFPIQNLPFCVFHAPGRPAAVGVAIGEQILDLSLLARLDLLTGDAALLAESAVGAQMNAMMALGAGKRRALRTQLSALLSVNEAPKVRGRLAPLLHRRADCTLLVPAAVPNYTDFYAGIYHAQRVGELFRPDAPLLPNYTYVPIGYHGRASTVRVSGTSFVRPSGQIRPNSDAPPTFERSRRLDFELEMGMWAGKHLGQNGPINLADAEEACWGFSLLNDWSARDIQTWEYQPLGPFLSKNFCTTVSPYVVTPEALAPFRTASFDRSKEGYPAPLEYLKNSHDQKFGGLDVELAVFFSSAEMRDRGQKPHRLSTSNAKHLYWTFAQMIAHHTSGGCDLIPGDLLGSGTISGPTIPESGSLLELTSGGRRPIVLGESMERTFLLDGDEISLQATCRREGFATIGFGECLGRVVAA